MLSWIHQAQEHGNCEQRLAETLTRLAVVDREREPFGGRLNPG